MRVMVFYLHPITTSSLLIIFIANNVNKASDKGPQKGSQYCHMGRGFYSVGSIHLTIYEYPYLGLYLQCSVGSIHLTIHITIHLTIYEYPYLGLYLQ